MWMHNRKEDADGPFAMRMPAASNRGRLPKKMPLGSIQGAVSKERMPIGIGQR